MTAILLSSIKNCEKIKKYSAKIELIASLIM